MQLTVVSRNTGECFVKSDIQMPQNLPTNIDRPEFRFRYLKSIFFRFQSNFNSGRSMPTNYIICNILKFLNDVVALEKHRARHFK